MLLQEKLTGRRLILASASPRRRQILAYAGLPFTVAEPYGVEEVWPAGMAAEKVAEYLAGLKSDAYPEPLAVGDILLTADTVVVLEGRILGKPRDRAEAREMLAGLSGRAHKVITGVVLRAQGRDDGTENGTGTGSSGGAAGTPEKRLVFSAESRVWFRELRPEEIDYYVDTFSPLDKAGSYGIQEWIGYVGCERIEGSFYNVMGLPMQMIYMKLDKFIEI
jgi:septum formation protein